MEGGTEPTNSATPHVVLGMMILHPRSLSSSFDRNPERKSSVTDIWSKNWHKQRESTIDGSFLWFSSLFPQRALLPGHSFHQVRFGSFGWMEMYLIRRLGLESGIC